jgi:putative CocE/NonD family hydrolase
MKRKSLYIPMRDGVRLAVDVFLPREVAEGKKVPTILNQTRYYRAWKLRFPLNLFLPDSQYTGLRKRLLKTGYAWVSVDVRGTGASFGCVKIAFSREQVEDAREIVDWIVRQHWSDGQVGGYGASYDGICAELLLVNPHPAVKAVMPLFSPHDLYEDITFPGGIFLSWFSKDWGDYNRALDHNALSEVKGLIGQLAIKGVYPVDEDRDRSLLGQAISEHSENWDIFGALHHLVYRDDQIHAGEPLSFDNLSPHARVDSRTKSSVPVYSYTGWFDAAYPRAAIRRFLSSTDRGSRLILGPWDHGGFHNVSPSVRRKNRFNHTGEVLKFFNCHLKGIIRGTPEEKPVKYYTMIEDRWRTSDTWPPPGARMHLFYLAGDNQLSFTKPGKSDGSDLYRVDNSAGSGTKSRWRTLTLSVRGAKLYPDRRERDSKLRTYTSQPLGGDLEVTGHPLVRFFISTDAEDACIFVYLEDVDENANITMVTEGLLRAIHRWHKDDYNSATPHRSFLKRDAKPLIPGEITELAFDLIPTSYLFKKNHSIRIAVAGADPDHFTPLSGAPPLLTFYRNARYPSCLELPVMGG